MKAGEALGKITGKLLGNIGKRWETVASTDKGWGWGWSKIKTTGRNGELGEQWKTLALKLGHIVIVYNLCFVSKS